MERVGYAAEVERVIRRIAELRPIALMQTAAKLVAAIANEEVSGISKMAVCGQQQGFVAGRPLVDNIIEVEGGLVEFTQFTDCIPASIFFDLAQVFPHLLMPGGLGRPWASTASSST